MIPCSAAIRPIRSASGGPSSTTSTWCSAGTPTSRTNAAKPGLTTMSNVAGSLLVTR